MADIDGAFKWGLLNRNPGAISNLLSQEGLLCFVGRSGGLADGEEYVIGGDIDEIFFGERPHGVVRDSPTRCLYFGAEVKNLADGAGVTVRVEYDIVTLTQSEQVAMLAFSGGCS